MSQYNVAGIITLTVKAGETILANQRIKFDAGEAVTAVADEFAIGFAQMNAAAGERVSVRLVNSQGTFKAIAKEAFAIGASLYGALAGKVQDTDPGAGTIRFMALEAATADGQIVEVLPLILK
jgi:hypothetical protein